VTVAAARPAIPALTGLRFFLAAAIVVYHYGVAQAARLPDVIRNVLGGGFMAVDVFFLLSGFVMAYNYLDHKDGLLRGSPHAFWRARVARIVPVYWIGMLMFTPLAIPQLWRGDAAAFGAIFVSAAMLVQAWAPPLAVLWNPPGWSLSVEAFFYLVFPRLGPTLWRVRRPYTAAGACWVALLAAAVLVSRLDPHPAAWAWGEASDACDWNKVLNFNPLLRLPEFAAGILACRIWRQGATWQSLAFLQWALPMGIAILLAWRAPLNADLVALGFFCPVFAAWLIVLAEARGGVSRFLALPACVRLGEWSYALYILHVPVWGLMLSANRENGEWLNPDELPFLTLTFVTAVGLSAAVSRFIEIPYRRAFLRALQPAATHA